MVIFAQLINQMKLLHSEHLFKDLWFKVRKDKYQTSKGKIIDPYYVYEFPTWVTAVALTEDNKMVMVRQYRHALGEVCIELPGGCVDDSDKDLETAIARELLEETGYEFKSYEYLGKISANPSTNNNLMHMFLAKGGIKKAEPKLDANEELEMELHTTDEVREMIRKNEIVQAMHLSCIWYAFDKLGIVSI
jgi:ADP-ribose pyrophosphatase